MTNFRYLHHLIVVFKFIIQLLPDRDSEFLFTQLPLLS